MPGVRTLVRQPLNRPRSYIDNSDRPPRDAVPAFALRFVGQETLPSRLSEFDREQFFELSAADVTAIREEFRSDHRLPAALMLTFMRVAGRPLDGFTVLPRNLLRHTAQMLGVSPPSIASLRSIYKRKRLAIPP